jgi:nicotinamide riboside transporter PnuC
MNIIKILDILTLILTVVSLYLVSKSYKYWLLYCLSTIFFIIVCSSNKIFGLTIMGVLLFITGLNNYRIGKNK